MGTARRYGTIFDAMNEIRAGNRAHAVRYENDDFIILTFQEFRHDQQFIFRIELVRAFVKNNDGAVLKQDPNEGKYLFFPA